MSSWLFLLLYKNKCFNEINDLPLFCVVVLIFQRKQLRQMVICACIDLVIEVNISEYRIQNIFFFNIKIYVYGKCLGKT